MLVIHSCFPAVTQFSNLPGMNVNHTQGGVQLVVPDIFKHENPVLIQI